MITTERLKGVDPDQVDLMTIVDAGRLRTLVKVNWPFAPPYIFSGLWLGVTISVAGAIVGEFVGGRRGLGVLLLQRQAVADVSGAFAIFVMLSVLGAIGCRTIAVLARRCLFCARWPSTQGR